MKLGIIGGGSIARAHVGCLKGGVPDAEVVGVSDISLEAAKKFAGEFEIKAFASNAELLASDIEGVFVCTHPAAHKSCVLEALEAGKHVFCEKPLAGNYEDGLEIAKAVEASDKKFQVGYLFHFSSTARKIKEMIDSGELGDLSVAWSQRFGYNEPRANHWISDEDHGGGILDFCTHDVEFIAWWGGRPKVVSATGITAHAAAGVTCIDTVCINMQFEKGIGTVLSTWASPKPMMNIGASGTKGSAAFAPGGGIVIQMKGGQEQINPPTEGQEAAVMIGEQQHFIDCCKNDETPSPGIAEGLLALEIEKAARESWRTGQAITLD